MPSASATEARGSVADSPARDRPVRRDLCQRHEHEGSVEELGMGQGQPIGRQRDVVIVDDVDVDHARAPALGGNPAELDLEPLDPVEQRLGRESWSARARRR